MHIEKNTRYRNVLQMLTTHIHKKERKKRKPTFLVIYNTTDE